MLPPLLRPVPAGRRSPLVRVTGVSVKIINPVSTKRRWSSAPRPPPPGPSETDLAACVFCHQPSYPPGGLGNLFGPYKVRKEEAWLHLDCVLWVPGVIMVSGNLLGLEEGVDQCKKLVCGECEKVGASVGCTHHGCEDVVHVVCGKDAGWEVDDDSLDARCPTHRRTCLSGPAPGIAPLKKTMSSFLLFAEEERPRVVAELGNISVREVGRELRRRWAVLDKDSRHIYETFHMEDKARYEDEMEDYQAGQQSPEQAKVQADSEEMTEYFSFLNENWMTLVMENNKMMEEKEVQEMVWQMWRKMKGVKTKRRKLNMTNIASESKTPVSAFLIFQSEMTEKLLKIVGMPLSNTEVLKMVAERWKTLDQDLKMGYEKKAEDMKAEERKNAEEKEFRI